MDEIIAKLNAEIRYLRQVSTPPAEYTQEVWRETLSYGSAYDKRFFNTLCGEDAIHPISKTLRRWWA